MAPLLAVQACLEAQILLGRTMAVHRVLPVRNETDSIYLVVLPRKVGLAFRLVAVRTGNKQAHMPSLVVRLVARATQGRVVVALVREIALMLLFRRTILILCLCSGSSSSVHMELIRRLNFAHHLVLLSESQNKRKHDLRTCWGTIDVHIGQCCFRPNDFPDNFSEYYVLS